MRSPTKAATSRQRVGSSSGSLWPRQLRDRTLNSISAILSQPPCLGVYSETPDASQCAEPRPLGRSRTATLYGECSDCPGPPVPGQPPDRLHPPASAFAPGRSPASCVVRSPPPAASRPGVHRSGTGCKCPAAGTRSSHASEPTRLCWQWFTGRRPATGGGFVEADHRPLRVVGFGVQIQDILHVGHEVGAHLGNAPLPLLPGLEQVFFKCSRTVSWDSDGASPNSTTLPASSRRVQWSWPSGAGLQASAIKWASARSSSFRYRWDLGPVLERPVHAIARRNVA